MLLGFGSALNIITIMKYLNKPNSRQHLIVQTIIFGAPQVIQFIIGVLPIFVSFSILGVALFCEEVRSFHRLTTMLMFVIE